MHFPDAVHIPPLLHGEEQAVDTMSVREREPLAAEEESLEKSGIESHTIKRLFELVTAAYVLGPMNSEPEGKAEDD